MTDHQPDASYADAVELNWWWILAGGAPSLVAAASITAAVDRAHQHDWWVLSAGLALVAVVAASSPYYPSLAVVTGGKNSRTLIRPKAGKTLRVACVAIGATIGVLLAGAFSLVAAMMESSNFDSYDDGYNTGFSTGIECGVDYSRNYDAYASCVADHNAGYRPPAYSPLR